MATRGRNANQTELWEQVRKPEQLDVPTARPSADPELAESFAAAALAWAKWQERRRWSGRAPRRNASWQVGA